MSSSRTPNIPVFCLTPVSTANPEMNSAVHIIIARMRLRALRNPRLKAWK